MKLQHTSIDLADGRELIYFDETPRPHPERDKRPLDDRPSESEVRYDALAGEWVAIAAHRGNRTYLPPADQCPLCPTQPGHPSEIPGEYDVAVFENRFPSLGPELGELPEPPSRRDSPVSGPGGWGVRAPGYGRCEVVAFTSEHEGSFSSLSQGRAMTVLGALAQRTEQLGRLPGIRQVFPFENRGEQIGVTMQHPHGQIYAYPYVTPRAAAIAESAERHFSRTGRVLLADILNQERSSGERMLAEGRHFSAFVPFAARWPLEAHIVPHRQISDLSEVSTEELEELSGLVLALLRRLDALYDSPTPYIAAWHQVPLKASLRQSGRLHFQVTSPRRAADKLKFLAGSEAAMGAFIVDATPEQIAAQLRSVELGSVEPGSVEPVRPARNEDSAQLENLETKVAQS
ncbi:galactose-1-phosphate uridylyltransferase [Acaricomes phytoseiuli]|uniref:galactose-1-phosphate uridylyltransferase n=1 Tax=Acaricomes phytoseiuli TaxID=291968 RepID=UPI0003711C57|nr:galactose-1-phosphate uridylyltransferase [Acaricomes phytoseiuli]